MNLQLEVNNNSYSSERNDTEEQSQNEILKNELEVKWREIEQKKMLPNIKNTKPLSIANKNKMSNYNNFSLQNANLRKLIHPVDNSFFDFVSNKIKQLEALKPKESAYISKRVLNQLKRENIIPSKGKDTQKSFLKSQVEEKGIPKITADDLIIIQQNQEKGREKIKGIFQMLNGENRMQNEDIDMDVIDSSKQKRTFLIEENQSDIENEVKVKKKKERAADKIININIGNGNGNVNRKESGEGLNEGKKHKNSKTFGSKVYNINKNTNNNNNSNSNQGEQSKIMKKIKKNSELIYKMFPAAMKK